MRKLILKTNGDIFIEDNDFETKQKTSEKIQPTNTGGLIYALSIEVELEEGYSLASLFEMVSKYSILENVTDFIDEYVKEYEEKYRYLTLDALKSLTQKDSDVESVDEKLCLYHFYDIDISDYHREDGAISEAMNSESPIQNLFKTKKVVGEKTCSVSNGVYFSLFRYYNDEQFEKIKENQPEYKYHAEPEKENGYYRIVYSISLSPISELLALPLVIRPKTTNITENLSTNEKKYEMYSYEDKYGVKDITLYDLVYGVFYELGFHGGPENTEIFKNELLERLNEVSETIELDDNDKGD